MKANANFKLSKPSKSLLGTIIDTHLRSEIKRFMINAEIAASIQPKANKNRKEQQGD